MKLCFPFFLLFAFSAWFPAGQQASGAEFFLQGSIGVSGPYWSDKSIWFVNESGGGDTAATSNAPFVGNRFNLNGFLAYTNPGTGTNTFSGTLVIDQSGTIIDNRIKTLTIASMEVTSGLRMRYRNHALTGRNFNINNLQISGATFTLEEANDGSTSKDADLTIGEIGGTGTVRLGAASFDDNNIWGLSAVDSDNDFTGRLRLWRGILDLDLAPLSLPNATFQLSDRDSHSSVVLTNDATFKAVQELDFDGANPVVFELSPGTYSAADLDLAFGTSGRFTGPGMLTVLGVGPEGTPGDFNDDGFVDAADYTVWRDNLGADDSTFPVGSTDPSSSTIDSGDYNLWRANFGMSAAGSASLSGSPVPEPSTMLLVVAGAVVALAARRRMAVGKSS